MGIAYKIVFPESFQKLSRDFSESFQRVFRKVSESFQRVFRAFSEPVFRESIVADSGRRGSSFRRLVSMERMQDVRKVSEIVSRHGERSLVWRPRHCSIRIQWSAQLASAPAQKRCWKTRAVNEQVQQNRAHEKSLAKRMHHGLLKRTGYIMVSY